MSWAKQTPFRYDREPSNEPWLTHWQGHGRDNASNVFGAALWAADYSMYCATLNISRVYYHHGTVFRYSAWQPIDINSTSLHHVEPLYYGYLFAAAAFAGGNKQVTMLLNETHVAAYAIYDRSSSGHGATKSTLESVVIVNLNRYEPEDGERADLSWKLPSAIKSATVKRLTAPAADSKTGITFAGQWVDNDGYIRGGRKVESVRNREVLVGASEAVLVTVKT